MKQVDMKRDNLISIAQNAKSLPLPSPPQSRLCRRSAPQIPSNSRPPSAPSGTPRANKPPVPKTAPVAGAVAGGRPASAPRARRKMVG